MAVRNLDALAWPLDTSVRVALFVPTTPDGRAALGAARSVYYCPASHGAICGLTFELYALLEEWVDPLRLARYMHNSYYGAMANRDDTSPLLYASLPAVWAKDLAPELLYVGVDECPQLAFAHPVFAGDPGGAPRYTRVVRVRTQNHHVLAHLAKRFFDSDEVEFTVDDRGTKRAAAFALLYMHHPERVHAPAAAAAEAAAARRKKPSRAGRAAKKDTPGMFRSVAAQHRFQWGGAADAAKPQQVLQWNNGLAAARADQSDVLRLEARDKREADEKRARAKAAKREGTVSVAKQASAAAAHLRLVRSTTVQAVFLQQVGHVKIDAFVHEHERELAETRAKFAEQARRLASNYTEITDAPADPVAAAAAAGVATRRRNAASLAFTRASELAVSVPAGAAEYVLAGRLTPGPVRPPDKATPDEVRRAYGTRPPLLEADVDDPNCVHWLVPVADVRFVRALGGFGRGAKRERADEAPPAPQTRLGPPPKQVKREQPLAAVKEEPLDMRLFDL